MKDSLGPFREVSLQSVSVSDQIFALLQDAIIKGKLSAGERLIESQLTAWLGVSRTPLREALAKLLQAGWLERLPAGGLRVKGISPKEVWDLYNVRAAIEGLIAASACRNMNEATLRDLAHHTELMELALGDGNLDEIASNGRHIHDVLAQVADNEPAREMQRLLSDRIQRYRNLSIGIEGRPQEAVDGHRHILTCLQARDEAAAEQAMRQHVLLGGQRLVESLQRSPTFSSQHDTQS